MHRLLWNRLGASMISAEAYANRCDLVDVLDKKFNVWFENVNVDFDVSSKYLDLDYSDTDLIISIGSADPYEYEDDDDILVDSSCGAFNKELGKFGCFIFFKKDECDITKVAQIVRDEIERFSK